MRDQIAQMMLSPQPDAHRQAVELARCWVDIDDLTTSFVLPVLEVGFPYGLAEQHLLPVGQPLVLNCREHIRRAVALLVNLEAKIALKESQDCGELRRNLNAAITFFDRFARNGTSIDQRVPLHAGANLSDALGWLRRAAELMDPLFHGATIPQLLAVTLDHRIPIAQRVNAAMDALGIPSDEEVA